jgi:hypothetical protein
MISISGSASKNPKNLAGSRRGVERPPRRRGIRPIPESTVLLLLCVVHLFLHLLADHREGFLQL